MGDPALPRALTTALTIAVIAAGCGSEGRPKSAGHAKAAATAHIACSVAVSYRSLRQLRRDAQSVAVFKPTWASSVQEIAGVPFTIATVSVLKTVAGAALPSTIRLRQPGAPATVTGPGCEPLVVTENLYLAYLTPFTFRRNGPAVLPFRTSRGSYPSPI
jgi:hypothetical protein